MSPTRTTGTSPTSTTTMTMMPGHVYNKDDGHITHIFDEDDDNAHPTSTRMRTSTSLACGSEPEVGSCLLHLPRMQKRAGGGSVLHFDAVAMSSPPSTSLVCKGEPEVGRSCVSTHQEKPHLLICGNQPVYARICEDMPRLVFNKLGKLGKSNQLGPS